MLQKLLTARSMVLKLLEKLKGIAPLLLRLTAGIVFIRTGWGKVHSLGDVTDFFASLHIPMPHFNAVLASYTELIGGAALILGVGARLVSVPLLVTMVVAIFTAVLKDPDLTDKLDLLRREEWHYLVIFICVGLLGPGPFSLDHFIAKKLDALKPPAPAAGSTPAVTT